MQEEEGRIEGGQGFHYLRMLMEQDAKYLAGLIAEGEHQQQDFKFEISSARKIAKTLVAFANTDGGRLLIGVKDNGRISGIRSEEEYYMIEAASTLYCKPEVPFQYFRRVVDGKMILEVIIESSENKPHYAKEEDGRWMAYHRVKDNNFLADLIQLQVWKRERREKGTFIKYTENEKRVLACIQEKEETDLDELKAILSMKKKTLQQILVNLISLRAVEMHFEENRTLYSPGEAQ